MNIITWLTTHLESPELILLTIPAAFFYFLILRKDFLQIKEEPNIRKRRILTQAIMLLTRTLMTLLLLIALAGPHTTKEHTLQGDPYITLLVDNSTSMAVFENIADNLQKALEKKVTVERRSIGSAEKSNLGDGILAHLQPRQNILLISDGNNNEGASLGDVALFASRMNATINALELTPVNDDMSISIEGPSKTMENIDNTYTIKINRAGKNAQQAVRLIITVDGKTTTDETTSTTNYEITQTFSKGYHTITARIESNDYFPTNNIFYKSVKAVPQPEVLFVSNQESPLQKLLQQLYKVTSLQQLPNNLKDYYAIIINNLPASTANTFVDQLHEYITDGNGMLSTGGKQSYELGEYRHSMFETLLPVFVGTPEKKPGDINIVLVIDISGSTGTAYASGKAVDVEKALAVGVLKDLAAEENLAVIAFNTAAYVISDLSKVYEKVNLEDRIASLKDGGGTLIGIGLIKAISLLDVVTGSKNIILISDGKTQGESVAMEAAKAAANKGIKIFTIGVGPQTNEEVMRTIADITNGVYFRANDQSRLKLIFGERDEKQQEGNTKKLTILNANHFITQGLEVNATVYGFNDVTPKTTSRLLVTTNAGDPILTVWRLGLGKAATLSSDDGTGWAGELLKKPDSKLLTRTINWLIGDPDRKSKEYIEARDTRINEPTEIIVKSETQPTAKELTFYKIDEDLYSATITPDKTGFHTIATATFAANYPVEYENIGISEDLKKVVTSTGGRFFGPNDIDQIITFAKTQARRTINEKEYVLWPWLTALIIIYLAEIFIRRLIRKEG
ncbi:VWA domain-containing protein [Candidatus Woesearchaeota archaeon]|nr:VWA domain-containing protein [Candidatus Woesearchaeota archaeon]